MVKCKDTGQYLLLYIPIDNKDNTWQIYAKQVIKHEEKERKQHLLYEALTETTMVQLIIAS